jgi:hypothetical protein
MMLAVEQEFVRSHSVAARKLRALSLNARVDLFTSPANLVVPLIAGMSSVVLLRQSAKILLARKAG